MSSLHIRIEWNVIGLEWSFSPLILSLTHFCFSTRSRPFVTCAGTLVTNTSPTSHLKTFIAGLQILKLSEVVMKVSNVATFVLSWFLFGLHAFTANGCGTESVYVQTDCQKKCTSYGFLNYDWFGNINGKQACRCQGDSETYTGTFICCGAGTLCQNVNNLPSVTVYPQPRPDMLDTCKCAANWDASRNYVTIPGCEGQHGCPASPCDDDATAPWCVCDGGGSTYCTQPPPTKAPTNPAPTPAPPAPTTAPPTTAPPAPTQASTTATVRNRLEKMCPKDPNANGMIVKYNRATYDDYLFGACTKASTCDTTTPDPISEKLLSKTETERCGDWVLNSVNLYWDSTQNAWRDSTTAPPTPAPPAPTPAPPAPTQAPCAVAGRWYYPHGMYNDPCCAGLECCGSEDDAGGECFCATTCPSISSGDFRAKCNTYGFGFMIYVCYLLGGGEDTFHVILHIV